ncbi:MAG: DUF6338 family protein, partial [Lactobacillus sp.]|nr:DUF6338 family protein [Lactobacillus sp.]
MDILEVDKLVLFIAFVIPGFISIKAYQLFCPMVEHPASEQLIDAIAYSCINYALFILPIWLVETSNLKEMHFIFYYLFYLIVLLVAPIGLAVVWRFLRSKNLFLSNVLHPDKRSWDFLFSQRKFYWAKVVLKNGNIIGGLYAELSNASSFPEAEQIYLQETWIIG